MRRAARRDANHNDIARDVVAIGGGVIDLTDSENAGFDMLVIFSGKLFAVEVKDGAKPPSKRKLTDNEQARREMLERLGASYTVVETFEDVVKLRNQALGIK